MFRKDIHTQLIFPRARTRKARVKRSFAVLLSCLLVTAGIDASSLSCAFALDSNSYNSVSSADLASMAPVSPESSPDEAAAEQATPSEELGYRADEIVVVYKQDASAEDQEKLLSTLDASEQDRLIDSQENTVAVLDIPDDVTVDAAVSAACANPQVEYAFPNYVMTLCDDEIVDSAHSEDASLKTGESDASTAISTAATAASASTTITTSATTTATTATSTSTTYAGSTSVNTSSTSAWASRDSLASQQFFLEEVRAPTAWNLIDSANVEPQTVYVAVIDSGADYSNTDLANVVDRDKSRELYLDSETGSTSWEELKGDGYWNGEATDKGGHGTHVSGIIGAQAGNGGVMGVASGGASRGSLVKLVVLDVLNEGTNGASTSLASMLKALEYAHDAGCSIANMSLGVSVSASSSTVNYLNDELESLSQDMLLIAAAGNDSMYSKYYKTVPAACSNVVGVVSLGFNTTAEAARRGYNTDSPQTVKYISEFSNYGSAYDLSAPGCDIISTYISSNGENQFAKDTGTSMAAPVVTGVAALVKSVCPNYSASQVRELLNETAEDLGLYGKDTVYGYGLVDAAAALSKALGVPIPSDEDEAAEGDNGGTDASDASGEAADESSGYKDNNSANEDSDSGNKDTATDGAGDAAGSNDDDGENSQGAGDGTGDGTGDDTLGGDTGNGANDSADNSTNGGIPGDSTDDSALSDDANDGANNSSPDNGSSGSDNSTSNSSNNSQSSSGSTVDTPSQQTPQNGKQGSTSKQNSSGNSQSSKASSTVRKVTMYRLYNKTSGEHFYTASTSERSRLILLGWKNEGVGWYAPISGNPVYRLYNKYTSDHHYTTSKNELANLVRLGWTYEGIGWYSSTSKEVPLYRQFNPYVSVGSHNYTTSLAENNSLKKIGWHAEGIAWYGVN